MWEIIVFLAFIYYLMALITVIFDLDFFAWLFALFIQLFNRQKSWWEQIRKWNILSIDLLRMFSKYFIIYWIALILPKHCDITRWRQRRNILIWILGRNMLLNIACRYWLFTCITSARNNLANRTLLLWSLQRSTRLSFDQHSTHRLQRHILWLNLKRKLNILNFRSLLSNYSRSINRISD